MAVSWLIPGGCLFLYNLEKEVCHMDSYDNDWLFMLDDDLFVVWNEPQEDGGEDVD